MRHYLSLASRPPLPWFLVDFPIPDTTEYTQSYDVWTCYVHIEPTVTSDATLLDLTSYGCGYGCPIPYVFVHLLQSTEEHTHSPLQIRLSAVLTGSQPPHSLYLRLDYDEWFSEIPFHHISNAPMHRQPRPHHCFCIHKTQRTERWSQQCTQYISTHFQPLLVLLLHQ